MITTLRAVAQGIALASITMALAAVACRQGQPGTDPQTPPNSPIPTIERTEPDPSGPPALPLGKDAG